MSERCEINDLDRTLAQLPEINAVAFAHMLRYLAVGKGRGRTLDACCGAGYGAEILRRLGYGPVVGFDQKIAPQVRESYPAVKFLETTLEAAVIHPRDWDLVVCFEALEHLADPAAAAAKLFAGVKPGGRFIASVPLIHPDRVWHRHVFTRARADRLFAALGGALRRHSLPTGHCLWEVVK